MDKKQKKRIQTLQEKLQKLRQQLAGAKKQMDDPSEVQVIQQNITAAEAELEKLSPLDPGYDDVQARQRWAEARLAVAENK